MKKDDAKTIQKAKPKAKKQKPITRSEIENVTGPLPYPTGAKIMLSRSMRAAVLEARKEKGED